MSYWGDKAGGSVSIPRQNVGFYVDTDVDYTGCPRMEIRRPIEEWFEDRGLASDWWIDDLGDLWFEFDERADAMVFKLAWNL